MNSWTPFATSSCAADLLWSRTMARMRYLCDAEGQLDSEDGAIRRPLYALLVRRDEVVDHAAALLASSADDNDERRGRVLREHREVMWLEGKRR